MMHRFVLIVLFFSVTASPLYANIDFIHFANRKEIVFSLKEVCTFMKAKESLLVTKISPQFIECMTEQVSVRDFCLQKKGRDQYFIRARITDRDLFCEFADELAFDLNCRNAKLQKLCKQGSKACAILHASYAHDLELVDSSSLKNEAGEKLIRCRYTSKKVEAIDTILPELSTTHL